MNNVTLNMIKEDFEKLSQDFHFEKSKKFSLIFNLIAIKYNIRYAFCWLAENFPDHNQYSKDGTHWSDFSMDLDGQEMDLKNLKEICYDMGLEMDLLEKIGGMKFNHDMIKQLRTKKIWNFNTICSKIRH